MMPFICSLKETRYIGLFASASRFRIAEMIAQALKPEQRPVEGSARLRENLSPGSRAKMPSRDA